ncbi:MAG: FMN-binding protein, partial [Clostridia bacterium]|nr:FMN-binding protein [Clostridia bacterium]
MEKKNLIRLIALAVVLVLGAVGGSIYWNNQNAAIYRTPQPEEQLAVLGAAKAEETETELVWAAKDKSGNTVGYIARETVTGFGGPIDLLVACDNDAKVMAVAIAGKEFAETPDLGMRVREAAYMQQFAGKAYPVALTSVSKLGDNRFACESKGFGGPVRVEVTLDADGKIAELKVGGEGFAETPGLGERALEPEFAAAFKGQSAPFAFGNGVDAIAGATITSNAVADALNKIFDYAANGGVEAISGATVSSNATVKGVNKAVEKINTVAKFLPEPEPVVLPEATGTEVSGTAKGFGGDVTVKMTVSGDTITAFEVT